LRNREERRILVVDDEEAQRELLQTVLSGEGYLVETSSSGEEALSAASARTFHLVILDLRMEGMGGLEVLRLLRETAPGTAVLMLTAYASVDTAVEAMRAGAINYLSKPVDIEELKVQVEKALSVADLVEENEGLRAQMGEEIASRNIIGRSPRLIEVMDTLRMAAPSDATILIMGESGTGKELVADAIHALSRRASGPLIKVNCAALPETLLESELFGHEKGAFTGAVARREGRFALANGGTLFLDEIGEMSPALQAKVLRVIQDRSFERVGGRDTLRVDVRLLVATNRDLEQDVRTGRFREDLYYRLNVIPVVLPPLRERPEDIALLAQHFLARFAARNGRVIRGFTPRALEILTRYGWRGNVRELENLMERITIMARSEMVDIDDLPANIRADVTPEEGGVVAGRSLRDLEKEAIVRTLEMTKGNRTETARLLGIGRRTLQYKLKEYAIMSDRWTVRD
jgi:DNA-binding NtrC family response regulator